jgi:hypothetical protein
MAEEAWLPLQIRCAPVSWTPMHSLELLQLRCQGIARIHGFRRSSVQPLSPRQRRRRWGWPLHRRAGTALRGPARSASRRGGSDTRSSWFLRRRCRGRSVVGQTHPFHPLCQRAARRSLCAAGSTSVVPWCILTQLCRLSKTATSHRQWLRRWPTRWLKRSRWLFSATTVRGQRRRSRQPDPHPDALAARCWPVTKGTGCCFDVP